MKQTFIVGVETDKTDFNDWIEEHDKQIRAKAIDQFAKELHRVLNLDGVCFPKTIDRIAEQLKEKNNE